jgi:Na+/glutamate symporter
MSNTSEMTPYQSSSAGLPGVAFACVAGAVIGAVVVAKWLCEETEAEVKQTRKKDSYFQLPGESAKTSKRVKI